MIFIRALKGLALLISVLLGVLLISNLDKGIVTHAGDQIRVAPKFFTDLKSVVAKQENATVEDETQGLVRVPDGEADKFVILFKQNGDVLKSDWVSVDPTFSFMKYGKAIVEQVNQYLHGNLGTIAYTSHRYNDIPIQSQLGAWTKRSLTNLVPGVLLGVIGGYLFALLAVWKPKAGKILDTIQNALLGIPDFFLVVVLQFLAVLLAQWAGHNVIMIMQFASETPVMIPVLAIAVLPGVLVYGAVRLAVSREWGSDYIKTAYSKGLGRTQVFLRHVLRNTMSDLFTILPRAVTLGVSSLIVAEVMTGTFGLGGYATNPALDRVTSLPTTCTILAMFTLVTHAVLQFMKKRLVIETKEGA